MNDLHCERSRSATAAQSLRQLIMGFRATQMVHVAAKLGLADHLRQGPRTPGELATRVGAEPRALYRLLRALASLGIFAETDSGAFETTPRGQLLETGVPESMRGMAILYGEEWLWDVYSRMEHSVRTGNPAFVDVHGRPLYEFLKQDAGARSRFQDAMTSYSAQESAAITDAYDFAPARLVVDIGGGQGALITAILEAQPAPSGIVFDLPEVVATAVGTIARAGLSDRVRCLGGDFFAGVPAGGDLYLLKSILHNWDDGSAVVVLRRCREAIADGGRLLVIERVIPPGNAPSEAKLFDVSMLVALGGQERTAAEYRVLLRAAGFEFTRVIPTHSALSLVEAVPRA